MLRASTSVYFQREVHFEFNSVNMYTTSKGHAVVVSIVPKIGQGSASAPFNIGKIHEKTE